MQKVNILFAISIIILVISGFVYNPFNDALDKDYSGKGEIIGTSIGNKAPELKYKSPDGKEIALSSIKDKLVLIDFWASWCGPCRRENPNIVSAYKKFKDKIFKGGNGFTIYSVSLDGDKNRWTDAIKKDSLSWKYHVSDLKKWQSEASQKYNVRSIPANFLINSKGIIIAKALRGQRLHQALANLMIKKKTLDELMTELRTTLNQLEEKLEKTKDAGESGELEKKIKKIRKILEIE